MKRWLLLPLASCADGVPETPSFQQDVAPIFKANCIPCHGYPQIRGAAPGIRYTYSDIPNGPFGAGHAYDPAPTDGSPTSVFDHMARRVAAREMPPRLELDDDQIETIVRWAEQGGQRGEPRPGNRPPVVTVVEVGPDEIVFDLRDPDGDILGGVLLDNGQPDAEIHQGRNRIALDPGAHMLTVEVDDGGDVFVLDVGNVP